MEINDEIKGIRVHVKRTGWWIFGRKPVTLEVEVWRPGKGWENAGTPVKLWTGDTLDLAGEDTHLEQMKEGNK